MILVAIVTATLAAGIGSVWLAALFGLSVLGRFTQHLLSLAAGALLATAFMHLLPEAFESPVEPKTLLTTLLMGVLFFFLLDKAELWHHGHEHHHGPHGHPAHAHDPHAAGHHHHPAHSHGTRPAQAGAWAILTGDSVHCFGDGILIASAFMADLRLLPELAVQERVELDGGHAGHRVLAGLTMRYVTEPDAIVVLSRPSSALSLVPTSYDLLNSGSKATPAALKPPLGRKPFE